MQPFHSLTDSRWFRIDYTDTASALCLGATYHANLVALETSFSNVLASVNFRIAEAWDAFKRHNKRPVPPLPRNAWPEHLR